MLSEKDLLLIRIFNETREAYARLSRQAGEPVNEPHELLFRNAKRARDERPN